MTTAKCHWCEGRTDAAYTQRIRTLQPPPLQGMLGQQPKAAKLGLVRFHLHPLTACNSTVDMEDRHMQGQRQERG
jgi:hypothetical protein